MLSIKDGMLNKKLGSIPIENSLSPFHKQVLQSWEEFFCVSPITNTEIVNEYVLDNNKIMIGTKYIPLKQFPNKHRYNLKLLDILDNKSCILKRDSLNQKLDSNINILLYNSIVTAIPSQWKTKLNQEEFINFKRWSDDISITINYKWIPLYKIFSKQIYANLIKG